MRSSTVYRHVVSAVALPLAAALLSQTVYAPALLDSVRQHTAGTWLAVVILVGLLVAELRYLTTLWGFARAGGRVGLFLSRRNDPVRRRRRRFRWTAAGLSAAVALSAAEAAFRLLEIEPPSGAVDCAEGLPGVDVSVNAMGIREDWDTLPEADRRLRIAFLGDSFTFGVSVKPEETLPHLVETELADAWPSGVVTINLGEIAAAPRREREIYGTFHATLHPDVVVQVINVNDFGAHLYRLLDDIYRIRDDRLWVGNASYLLRYVEKQVRYWIVWNQTLGYFRGGLSPEQRSDSWAVFETEVRACAEEVQADGATYALVLFPWLYRLDQYQLRGMHAKVRRFAMDLGVPYLDLLEVFDGMDGETLRVCPLDTHPNAEGYRLAAEGVARFLRRAVLAEMSGDPVRPPGTPRIPATMSTDRDGSPAD